MEPVRRRGAPGHAARLTMDSRRFRRGIRLRATRVEPSELDDEFQFHLAMRGRELEQQGHAPADARRLALARFGDIDEARRYCRAEDEERMRTHRRILGIDNLRQDLRLALRALRRNPAFATSTVLTLGLAIAIATTAYGILHAYLVRPLPYPDAGRLVFVRPAPTRDPFPNMPRLDGVDWGVADSVFSDVVTWDLDAFTVAGVDRTESVHGAWVSPGYFRALGMQPALGRAFEPGEFAPGSGAVIISDAFWSRGFGRDPAVIGRDIRIQALDNPDAAELATVVGILPRNMWHVNRFTDVIRPLAPGSRFPPMARLAPGMSLEEAEARLNALVFPQVGNADPAWRLSLATVQEEYTHRLRPALVALLGAALFLLLIAGASVAGAQAARAAARRAEVGVRMALGASRGRIGLQLLTESVLVALLAGVIGATVAATLLATVGDAVSAQLGASIPGGSERLPLGAALLLTIAGAGALLGAVAGLLPALLLARAPEGAGNPLGAGKGTVASVASPVLRRALIVGQVAVTTMLLVGAGLMARTVLTIATTSLGFVDTQVVKGDMFLPPARYPDSVSQRAAVDRLLSQFAAVPEVREVAVAFPDPLRMFTLPEQRAITEGLGVRPDSGPPMYTHIVTPRYFDVLGIQLRSGRSFGAQDDSRAPLVAMVSEELAQALWPGESAIGRRLRTAGDSTWRTVVGVVGEVRQPVETDPSGEVYLPFSQNTLPLFFALVRATGDPAAIGSGLQRAVSQVDQGLGLANLRPLSELADGVSSRHRALATVLLVFGAIALGLAMLGLYASLAYVVAQRRREIAIRVAVGADARAIRRLIARDGVLQVASGMLVGVTSSLALTRVLSSQLYGVTPTDPLTFAAMAVILGAAGLLAALTPVRTAARVEPAEIMRSE